MKAFQGAVAGVAAVLVLVLALGAAAPYIVDGKTVRDQFVARLSAWAEGRLRVSGDVQVKSLFDLTLKAADVEIRAPQRFPEVSNVRADLIEARLNVWELLNGRVVFDKVWVTRPVVTLRAALDGMPRDGLWRLLMLNEPPVIGQLVEAAERAPFLYIKFSDARLAAASGEQLSSPLGEFSIAVSRDSASSLVTVSGDLTWEGQPIGFALERSPFQPSGPTREAKTRLDVEGAALGRLTAEGRIVRANGTRFVGSLELVDAPLGGLAEWLGIPAGTGLAATPYTATAAVEATPDSISLQRLELAVGDARLTGLVGLALGGEKPTLTGTLGLDSADLRYLTLSDPRNGVFITHDPLRARRGGASYSARRVGEWLQSFNADLRISAGRLLFDGVTSGEAAAFLSVNDGRATLDIAELMVFGGLMNGQFSLQWRDNRFLVEGKGNAAGAQLERLLAHLGGSGLASGRADISFALNGDGSTPGAVLRDMRATGRLVALQGGDIAIDVGALAERGLQRRRYSDEQQQAGIQVRPSRGEYAMLQSDFRLNGQHLRLDRLEILQDGWMIRGRGDADFSTLSTDLRVSAARIAPGQESQASFSAMPGASPLAEETIRMHLMGSLNGTRVIYGSQARRHGVRDKRAGWP